MQLVPAALVPAVRQYIQSQGADPAIFNNDGSVNPLGAVGLFFDTVTVRTSITPDITFPINASGQPPSRAGQELLEQLQPVVVMSGRAGTVEVAPYGMPVGRRSWLPVVLVGAGAVLFIGWAVFGGRR